MLVDFCMFFFFRQKAAGEGWRGLLGWGMFIRDRSCEIGLGPPVFAIGVAYPYSGGGGGARIRAKQGKGTSTPICIRGRYVRS